MSAFTYEDPDQPDKSFGRAIRKARELKDLSHEGLARLMGLSVYTIRNAESGRGPLSAENAIKVCKILGLDKDTMLALRARQRDAYYTYVKTKVSEKRAREAGLEPANTGQPVATVQPGREIALVDSNRPRAMIDGDTASLADGAALLNAILNLSPRKQKLVINFVSELAAED